LVAHMEELIDQGKVVGLRNQLGNTEGKVMGRVEGAAPPPPTHTLAFLCG
jgi:hypothetical protein